MKRVTVIDSHTGGEPTRVVLAGAPDFGGGTVAEQLAVFREKHDAFRQSIILEPRGSDVLVGALLCEPADASCAAGVIFFNNVGYLGMCGHGLMGLVVTLAHMGRISEGTVRVETPVGVVEALWHGGSAVSVANVPSYRTQADIRVELPGRAPVLGDVAWGGNWFFLTKSCEAEVARGDIHELTELAWAIRRALAAQGHPEVDHIDLVGAPKCGGDARNFLLCPGGAYDRSPCGTGTSAKLACLAAEGLLAEGDSWLQESIIGSQFRGSYRWVDRERGHIAPTITGTAFVTAEAVLVFRGDDPFRNGIVPTV